MAQFLLIILKKDKNSKEFSGGGVMQGMRGVSATESMPGNCGIEGMHGNVHKMQGKKLEYNAVKQQNNQAVIVI